jgi:hypothetical protein
MKSDACRPHRPWVKKATMLAHTHLSSRGTAGAALLALVLAGLVGAGAATAARDNTWSVKADYIEACSCHLFCPCYFNKAPEGGMHCEFNNAVKIVEAHVGDVKLDGVKLWISGDLGGDFTKPLKSAVITVEPSATAQQVEAIKYLVGKIYPFKWQRVAVDRAPITWEKNGMNGRAVLGNRQGEVVLTGVKGQDGQPVVIQNLQYWGAQKNTGFYPAKSRHHYKGHGHNYSYKDNNGFFIHIESSGTMEK